MPWENKEYIKPSVDLQKINFKESLNIFNKNLIAEYEMYIINGDIKPNNKTKNKVLIFNDLILVLRKKLMSYEPLDYIEINQTCRILELSGMKYFSYWIKITNSQKCIILRTDTKNLQKEFIQQLSDLTLSVEEVDNSM